VDLIGQDSWSIGSGRLTFSGNGSWLNIKEKLLSTEPEMQISGIIFNPPDFKGRASLAWLQGPWSLVTTANYIGREWDNSTTPAVRIASWTTADAQIGYAIPAPKDWSVANGLRVSLSIQNMFDRDPPRVRAASTIYPGLGYDPANASPIGRFISLYVAKHW
jgi:outer membrane receptor protein involved in Fe transport